LERESRSGDSLLLRFAVTIIAGVTLPFKMIPITYLRAIPPSGRDETREPIKIKIRL
jgi:hypothetical protein